MKRLGLVIALASVGFACTAKERPNDRDSPRLKRAQCEVYESEGKESVGLVIVSNTDAGATYTTNVSCTNMELRIAMKGTDWGGMPHLPPTAEEFLREWIRTAISKGRNPRIDKTNMSVAVYRPGKAPSVTGATEWTRSTTANYSWESDTVTGFQVDGQNER